MNQEQLDALKARIDRTLDDCGKEHSQPVLVLRDVRAALDLLPKIPEPKTLSGWWMNDNHTFARIDLNSSGFRDEVMAHFDRCPWGSFFVRVLLNPGGEVIGTIFDVSGRGRDKRDEFQTKLNAWSYEKALKEIQAQERVTL
jgi:hypothetical protein